MYYQQYRNIADRFPRATSKLFSLCFIFLLSGTIYYFLEVVYRGYSHYSMFLCAGICGLVIMFLNDYFYEFSTDFRVQAITAGIFCSIAEYGIGEIFNRNYTIWDYRGLWGTLTFLDSQVNLIFVSVWILLSCFAIPFLDYIQWKLGLGERPWYRIGKKYFIPWEEEG